VTAQYMSDLIQRNCVAYSGFDGRYKNFSDLAKCIRFRSRDLGDQSKLKDDGSLRETFTLPLYVARLKARQILDEYPAVGYMTIVEKWRALPARSNSRCGGCRRRIR
jgi:hypothetical protein